MTSQPTNNETDESEAMSLLPDSNTDPDIMAKKLMRRPLSGSITIFGAAIPSAITSNPTNLFVLLAASAISFSLLFAFLQEKVTSIEGFTYPKFMTVVQTSTFALCAFLEMMLSSGAQGNLFSPKAPKFNYFILSFLTFGGMLFTNWGLKYLSYPTRIIFKGAKPVPTMLLEYLYVGRIFSSMEVLSVGILTFGIILFCSGEASGAPTFNMTGVMLMTLGVTADSLTSNYEKKQIFCFGSTHTEAMFWASLYGAAWSVLTLIIMDWNLCVEAFAFVTHTPEALVWLFISSIGGYMSVVFVLLLIKHFSTTYTECVKGVRKVLSIALSYLLLGSEEKTFGLFHGMGVLCFMVSIGMSVYNKSQSQSKK